MAVALRLNDCNRYWYIQWPRTLIAQLCQLISSWDRWTSNDYSYIRKNPRLPLTSIHLWRNRLLLTKNIVRTLPDLAEGPQGIPNSTYGSILMKFAQQVSCILSLLIVSNLNDSPTAQQWFHLNLIQNKVTSHALPKRINGVIEYGDVINSEFTNAPPSAFRTFHAFWACQSY